MAETKKYDAGFYLKEQLIELESGAFIELFYDDRQLFGSSSNLRIRIKDTNGNIVEGSQLCWNVLGDKAHIYVNFGTKIYLFTSSIVTGYVDTIQFVGDITVCKSLPIKRIRDANLKICVADSIVNADEGEQLSQSK